MILVSSNDNKLKEFKRFGLDLQIEKGRDLKEVAGTYDEVAIYKALEAGEDRVVEDTILIVEGKEVVDIRWKINELPDNAKAVWKTTLAFNNGIYIYLYEGIVEGKINKVDIIPEDCFGFDAYFIPNTTDKNLYDLEKSGLKDEFSARSKAAKAMISKNFTKQCKIKAIPPWTGKYQ